MIDTAIILATGNKAHQSKLIYNRPRTMLPALGKPLVVRAMDRLHRIGIQKYIVVLGEKEGNVASYLNTKWLPDVSLEFVLKRDSQPLGRTLKSVVASHDAPTLITSYNSFTHGKFPERLIKYHELSPKDLILSGATNSLSLAASQMMVHVALPGSKEIGYNTTPRTAAEEIASVGDERIANHQNLTMVDIVACGQDTVAYIKNLSAEHERLDSLADLVEQYVADGNCTRMARSSWVLQVNADEDLLTLNRHLLDEDIDAHILSELPYTVRIVQPVRIDPGVNIGQGAIIGPHVYLEQGSSVGREAHLKNTIVMQRATVNAKEKVQDTIVSTRNRIALTRSDPTS